MRTEHPDAGKMREVTEEELGRLIDDPDVSDEEAAFALATLRRALFGDALHAVIRARGRGHEVDDVIEVDLASLGIDSPEKLREWLATIGLTVEEFQRLDMYGANVGRLPWLGEL